MNEKNLILIKDFVLVYSTIILIILLFLTIIFNSLKPILEIAYFIYVIEFVLVAGYILFKDLLNKNFEETEKT